MFAFLARRGDLTRTRKKGGALQKGTKAYRAEMYQSLVTRKGETSKPKLRIPKYLVKRYGPRGGLKS